jgi:hypothetical protein
VQMALPLRPSLAVGLPRPTSYLIILFACLVTRWSHIISRVEYHRRTESLMLSRSNTFEVSSLQFILCV